MRKIQADYRSAADALVLEFVEASGQLFFTREQIAQRTGVVRRGLDRALKTLASQRLIARFHLTIEDGELSPIQCWGSLPRAFSFRRLNFILQNDGSYLLSESSSDDVSCYISRNDVALADTERQAVASTFFALTRALIPTGAIAPGRNHIGAH